MRFRTALITLVSFVLLCIQPTYAKPNPDTNKSVENQQVDWGKRLGLSDKQKQQIKQIEEDNQDDLNDLRIQKWNLYKTMMMMGYNKKLDQSKIDEVLTKMNAVSEKHARQEIEGKHEIFMILNAEQQKTLTSMVQNRLKSMEKIHGR